MSNHKSALKHALHLEAFTIAWNVIEAFVAVGIGLFSGSVALVAFGFDSMIETVAAAVLFWRLFAEYKGDAGSEEAIERVERKASYWVGVTFMLLAAYVLYESVETLMARETAHPGIWGVGLAALSSLVMPVLWRLKLKAADAVGSRAMRSEAAETIICAYLSFVLLAGLLLNYLFGWWWVDPLAALVMLYFIVKEGLESFAEARGEHCSCGSGGCDD